MFHVSLVTCHLSHVKKFIYFIFIFFILIFFVIQQKKIDKVVKLVGEGSVINGTYPV